MIERDSRLFLELELHTAAVLADSNSTRTESCVSICPDANAARLVDAPKAADHNRYQQLIRRRREM
jgi:hypothetical protein